MTIRRIVPNISSNNLDKSKEFYRNFLGLTLAMDMEWILTFVSDSNPTAQISIIKNDKADNSNTSVTISVEVSDIDELYKKAKSFGYETPYEITNEPWGVRRFFVKDPNDVIVNVMMHLKDK